MEDNVGCWGDTQIAHTLLPRAPLRMLALVGGQTAPAGRRGVPYPREQPAEQGLPTPPPAKRRAGSVGNRTGDKKSRVSSTWERGRGAPQSPIYLLYVPDKVPSILMSDTERPHQSGWERGQSRRAKAFPSAHPRALEREGRTNRRTRDPSMSKEGGKETGFVLNLRPKS